MKKKSIPMKVAMVASVLSLAAFPIATSAADWQQDVTGAWMLVDDSGLALKGWQNMNGNTYYLDDMGHMVTGMQTINGETYYFNEDGIMARDWWYKDGYSHFGTAWYYFQNDGRMAHGWTMASDGKVYYFDSPDYPGATWMVSGQSLPELIDVASVMFHHAYGDVIEVLPNDMTASRAQFWQQLKNATGASDEIVEAMVNLVPGKWYQQADRCAAVLWNQGYDGDSAYTEMINRGFTEDQAKWACCMKWQTRNENGQILNEKGQFVSDDELIDSHINDINENIDTEYANDCSMDVTYRNGPYTYTMTGVNAYRTNSNVPEPENKTLEDFNYFEDIPTPGSDPGNAWKGDVPPTEIPDDPTAAIVPVTQNEDGSWSMDMNKWEEVNAGLETGEYHALGYPSWLTEEEIQNLPSPAKAYADEHGLDLEDVYNAAKGMTSEDEWIYVTSNSNQEESVFAKKIGDKWAVFNDDGTKVSGLAIE